MGKIKEWLEQSPDCPPDAVYFLDPSQARRGDLSHLSTGELLAVQGDLNEMFRLMHEHSRPVIPAGAERSIGSVLYFPREEK